MSGVMLRVLLLYFDCSFRHVVVLSEGCVHAVLATECALAPQNVAFCVQRMCIRSESL